MSLLADPQWYMLIWTARRRFCYNERKLQTKHRCDHLYSVHRWVLMCHQEE
jgi:hypothetical protein